MNTRTRMTSHKIQIQGASLVYGTIGDPALPPLIMVHGWLSFGGVFESVAAQLCDRYYCIAVDLLGHGDSDKPRDGDYSIAAQAGRVVALLDALMIQQPIYLGHSMGALIGYYITLHYPDRIQRLIDVAGVVNGKLSRMIHSRYVPILRMGAHIPAIWIVSRTFARFRWYSDFFDAPLLHKKHLGMIRFDSPERQMALQRGIEIPMWRDLQAIWACDLSGELARIRIPVRVIFGAEDNCVAIENGHLVKARVPDSALAIIEECGHIPFMEQPAQFMAHLDRFLVS